VPLDVTVVRFLLVGCVNTLVGSALMFTLYNFAGFSYWLASACNYFLTSILSFFLNKYFTFRVKRWSAAMVAAFVLTIVVSYVVAYSVAKPAVYALLGYFYGKVSERVRDNSAMLAGMCLFTVLNYLGQRLVAIRVKEGEK
jgi:putative flippase GtrA